MHERKREVWIVSRWRDRPKLRKRMQLQPEGFAKHARIFVQAVPFFLTWTKSPTSALSFCLPLVSNWHKPTIQNLVRTSSSATKQKQNKKDARTTWGSRMPKKEGREERKKALKDAVDLLLLRVNAHLMRGRRRRRGHWRRQRDVTHRLTIIVACHAYFGPMFRVFCFLYYCFTFLRFPFFASASFVNAANLIVLVATHNRI